MTALFVGRVLYRFSSVYAGALAPAAPNQSLVTAYQHSPLTLAMFGALVGYYALYYLGVLRRTSSLTMSAQEIGPDQG